MSFRILLAFSCIGLPVWSQTGCTDPLAINYSASATINDGSCIYPSVTKTPQTIGVLSAELNEISGLVQQGNYLIGHTDDTDPTLFFLDPSNGQIQTQVSFNTHNKDWEDIAIDSDQVYIGDFGNNQSGNRNDLKIYRINKASTPAGYQLIDSFQFSYGDQTNFSNQGPNNTDFDCEAMISYGDSLYLFSKQWVHPGTKYYAVSKNATSAQLLPRDSLALTGLVTGATSLENKNLIVLCGYSSSGTPFLELLYDFPDNNFFGGNKRKIGINANLHQVESVTTTDGLIYYIANEKFTQGSFTVQPKLMKIDLSAELGAYLYPTNNLKELSSNTRIFPNPFHDRIQLKISTSAKYTVQDSQGKLIDAGTLLSGENCIALNVPAGYYILRVENQSFPLLKLE